MLRSLKNGQTSVITRLKLRHSTTGAGLTGLTEVSSGLIIGTIANNEATTTRYRAGSSEIETIATLGTFSAPTSGKCRFKEVDSTNHPGLYEIQLADARWAVSSAKTIVITVLGATNLTQTDASIELWSVDPFDTVRFGMTALPNAAAEAAGGLYTRGSGAGQITQDANGRINVNVKAYGDSNGTFSSGRPEVNASHAAGTAWNSGAISASTLASDTIAAAKIAADAITAAKIADGAIDAATFAAGAINAAAIASDAITAAKVADGTIDAATFATGAITAAAIAADAIGASELAADAVAEIQSGLSTLDAAGVRAAVGLSSANLDTQLAAIDDYVDTEVAAIKAVTDQLVSAQSEPTAAPAANATILEKIAWLAALARNKVTQTSTTQTLKADDGATTIATAAVSDDGTTFTRAEWQ